jgi:hypothetical protein
MNGNRSRSGPDPQGKAVTPGAADVNGACTAHALRFFSGRARRRRSAAVVGYPQRAITFATSFSMPSAASEIRPASM